MDYTPEAIRDLARKFRIQDVPIPTEALSVPVRSQKIPVQGSIPAEAMRVGDVYRDAGKVLTVRGLAPCTDRSNVHLATHSTQARKNLGSKDAPIWIPETLYSGWQCWNRAAVLQVVR